MKKINVLLLILLSFLMININMSSASASGKNSPGKVLFCVYERTPEDKKQILGYIKNYLTNYTVEEAEKYYFTSSYIYVVLDTTYGNDDPDEDDDEKIRIFSTPSVNPDGSVFYSDAGKYYFYPYIKDVTKCPDTLSNYQAFGSDFWGYHTYRFWILKNSNESDSEYNKYMSDTKCSDCSFNKDMPKYQLKYYYGSDSYLGGSGIDDDEALSPLKTLIPNDYSDVLEEIESDPEMKEIFSEPQNSPLMCTYKIDDLDIETMAVEAIRDRGMSYQDLGRVLAIQNYFVLINRNSTLPYDSPSKEKVRILTFGKDGSFEEIAVVDAVLIDNIKNCSNYFYHGTYNSNGTNKVIYGTRDSSNYSSKQLEYFSTNNVNFERLENFTLVDSKEWSTPFKDFSTLKDSDSTEAVKSVMIEHAKKLEEEFKAKYPDVYELNRARIGSESEETKETSECIKRYKDDKACGSVYFIPQQLPFLTNLLMNLIKIVTPIILIIKGIIDLFKAVTGANDKEIEKARAKFFKRLIPAVAVFLSILVIQFVFGIIATDNENNTFIACSDCFLNNSCQKTPETKIKNYCGSLEGEGNNIIIDSSDGGQGSSGGLIGTENLPQICIEKEKNCGSVKSNGSYVKCFIEKGSDYRDTLSDANKCRTDTIYQGKKYNLTEQQRRKIAGMILGEYGNDEAGMKAVASQMANNYEKWRYYYKSCATTRTLYEYVIIPSGDDCHHYATADKPASDNQLALKVVEDVLVNGNRTLPLYVDEFDMFPNDINTFGQVRKKSSEYIQGVTDVKGCYGGEGIFYCMAQNSGDANLHYYTKKYKEFVDSGKLDKAIREDTKVQ